MPRKPPPEPLLFTPRPDLIRAQTTKRAAGKAAQQAGNALEQDLAEDYHPRLWAKGIYVIRTSQPMKAVWRPQGPMFVPVAGLGGVPDFHAIVGRTPIGFDAKSCASDRWPLSNLDTKQADSFDRIELGDGHAAVYLRFATPPVLDVWIPWTALEMPWRTWAKGRAATGTASLTRAGALALGTQVRTLDWIAALPEKIRAAR